MRLMARKRLGGLTKKDRLVWWLIDMHATWISDTARTLSSWRKQHAYTHGSDEWRNLDLRSSTRCLRWWNDKEETWPPTCSNGGFEHCVVNMGWRSGCGCGATWKNKMNGRLYGGCRSEEERQWKRQRAAKVKVVWVRKKKLGFFS